MGIAGAITAAAAGRKAYKNQGKIIDRMEKDNLAWYNRRYNEDATERADAVAALAKQREVMAERNARNAGAAAIMGGTSEAMAAEKQAQNAALADTASQIALAGAARKDAIEQQFINTRDAIAERRMQREAERAKNVSAAGSQLSSMGAGLIEGGAKMMGGIL